MWYFKSKFKQDVIKQKCDLFGVIFHMFFVCVIFKIVIFIRCDILNVAYIEVWHTKITLTYLDSKISHLQTADFCYITPCIFKLSKYHTYKLGLLEYYNLYSLTFKISHLQTADFLYITPGNFFFQNTTLTNRRLLKYYTCYILMFEISHLQTRDF